LKRFTRAIVRIQAGRIQLLNRDPQSLYLTFDPVTVHDESGVGALSHGQSARYSDLARSLV